MKTQLHQIIPNEVCFSCEVCCRFLEADSPLAPIFTEAERERVILQGADRVQFQPQADRKSAQIVLEASRLENALTGYICPFFDEETSHCTIYPIRPLDCQLYPFALMFNEDRNQVVLGVDILCPFAEAEMETEAFHRHIRHVIAYVESEAILAQIAENWSLIGDYQDTVKIVHPLDKLEPCNFSR